MEERFRIINIMNNMDNFISKTYFTIDHINIENLLEKITGCYYDIIGGEKKYRIHLVCKLLQN